MGKRLSELNAILNMYKDQSKEVLFYEEDKFFKSLEASLLTDIARSLAIIADETVRGNDLIIKMENDNDNK